MYDVQITGITTEAALIIAQQVFGQFSGAVNYLTGCILGVGCALGIIKGLKVDE